MMTDGERCAGPETRQSEPRDLNAVSVELQRRLDDASRTLQGLKTQQATCSALLGQFHSDLDAAVALSREIKELAEHKAEEPTGVVATLQAAVEKTKDTVAGQVEHVRGRAVAAFHRLKSNGPQEESEERKKFNDRR